MLLDLHLSKLQPAAACDKSVSVTTTHSYEHMGGLLWAEPANLQYIPLLVEWGG
jgi:hypothetical protein